MKSSQNASIFYPGSFDDGNVPRKGGEFELVDEEAHDTGSDADAFALADIPFPGKFGVFYEKNRPTKNELEQRWIDSSREKTGGASAQKLLADRFALMK